MSRILFLVLSFASEPAGTVCPADRAGPIGRICPGSDLPGHARSIGVTDLFVSLPVVPVVSVLESSRLSGFTESKFDSCSDFHLDAACAIHHLQHYQIRCGIVEGGEVEKYLRIDDRQSVGEDRKKSQGKNFAIRDADGAQVPCFEGQLWQRACISLNSGERRKCSHEH